ncbi:hypothetical protein EG68_02588 [Paragonimus skrjabini miyazakii]|uniref:Uncharacterized protein n=1 Tax=Paragonimus skrjabini miyazakii TaxID=59628 RepID=A0A8S9YZL4_9TREM|nr:hypothetical protein EG68_02588 [Paragonimus skrjabini miyazakii]
METVLIFISLLVLFDDALAQTGPAPERLSSTFKGILYNGTTRILDPHNLTANQSKQVQARLCRQMTYLVPWYAAHRNTSNCTIHITNRSWVYLTYTIPVTEDLIQKYDPSCSTYYILLANLVRRVDTLAGYHLDLITLENQNPVQLVSPSDSTSSTKIRVDGPVFKLAGRLRWEEFTHFEDLTKEVGENVRKQFVTFLKLHPNNGSYIHTEQKRIYRDPEYQTLTRMEA